jgi:hypothetical protein
VRQISVTTRPAKVRRKPCLTDGSENIAPPLMFSDKAVYIVYIRVMLKLAGSQKLLQKYFYGTNSKYKM